MPSPAPARARRLRGGQASARVRSRLLSAVHPRWRAPSPADPLFRRRPVSGRMAQAGADRTGRRRDGREPEPARHLCACGPAAARARARGLQPAAGVREVWRPSDPHAGRLRPARRAAGALRREMLARQGLPGFRRGGPPRPPAQARRLLRGGWGRPAGVDGGCAGRAAPRPASPRRGRGALHARRRGGASSRVARAIQPGAAGGRGLRQAGGRDPDRRHPRGGGRQSHRGACGAERRRCPGPRRRGAAGGSRAASLPRPPGLGDDGAKVQRGPHRRRSSPGLREERIVSGSRQLRTVGVLPALGSGLTDLRRTGQHERLLNYDLRHYCEAYDRVYYFSYFQEALADFTRDPLLLDKVVLLPRRGKWPARAYAFLLPMIYRRQIRECEALRVEQFSGVIPALVARRFDGVPFVVTYGYHYGEVARIAGSRLKPRLYAWLERAAFPRAAGVIVTSREMETRLSAHPARPRLAYFPNGVDTESFAPPPTPRAPSGPPTVLYVGRLEEEKNVGRLIEGLALVSQIRPRLRLVGDGRLRDDLETRARAAGIDTDFAGVIPHGQLPQHFRSADCFVLPSLTEGHPKALIEAMACGLPCAASARGGIPSILEDGVTSLLFAHDQPQDIARAVGRLLSDQAFARRLGERARASALAHYDAHALLKAEVAFVQSVAGTGSLFDLFEDYARDVRMDETLPEFV